MIQIIKIFFLSSSHLILLKAMCFDDGVLKNDGLILTLRYSQMKEEEFIVEDILSLCIISVYLVGKGRVDDV